MKQKTRIKSFWRRNKKFVPMYFTIINALVGIVLLPFTFPGALNTFVNAMLWSFVWVAERKTDFYRRSVYVVHHKAWKAAQIALHEEIKKLYESKTKNNETED